MTLFEQNIARLKDRHPELSRGISSNPSMAEIQEFCSKTGTSIANLLLYNLDAQNLAWHKIKFVFLDVDGVLTEGGMFYTESGDEFKRFDTKDGMAIKVGMKGGLQFGIISSGINKAIIQHRADMFGIEHVYVGTDPKVDVANAWVKKLGLDWDQVGYIGDDINDLEMFGLAGITAAPSDAADPIKGEAAFILASKGGHGCVREFLRYIPNLESSL